LILERILPIPARVASLAPRNFEDARRLVALVPKEADAIEFRLDLADVRVSPRALLDLDPRPEVITWRSAAEGGRFAGGAEEYRRAVQSAYDAGATVDVELESGLLSDPEFLPERRRVVGSRHSTRPVSRETAAAYAGEHVRAVKLVHAAPRSVTEAASSLAALAGAPAGGAPLAIFAMGKLGLFTRPLAARMGSALTYGSVERATADGQIPLGDLVAIYGAGQGAPERIFAIFGGDVSRSLSPLVHNALFARRGLRFLYVPVFTPSLADGVVALDSVLGNLGGASVTSPLKEAYGGVAEADPQVREIGAANTLVRRRPECLDLSAHNTDAVAVAETLESRGMAGREVFVLGAGGAAAAAVFAARKAGCPVTVAGRNLARARDLARRLGARAVPAAAGPPAGAAVLVNATPLGSGEDDPLPFAPELLEGRSLVIDFAYRDRSPTRLEQAARETGCRVAGGLELLARQAARQAQLFGVADARYEEVAEILGIAEPGAGELR
jgi:shikimate dehydrogenase/3-dehydroquinate dehydratase type I